MGDSQPQPGALRTALTRRVDPEKAVKHPNQMLKGNGLTLIGHTDFNAMLQHLQAHRHSTAGVGVAQRIGQQVAQRPAQHQAVGADRAVAQQAQ